MAMLSQARGTLGLELMFFLRLKLSYAFLLGCLLQLLLATKHFGSFKDDLYQQFYRFRGSPSVVSFKEVALVKMRHEGWPLNCISGSDLQALRSLELTKDEKLV